MAKMSKEERIAKRIDRAVALYAAVEKKRSGCKLPRTIAIGIQKGGVGKSTLSANLGACLAARGKKVLLVDMDPQMSLTITLGADMHEDFDDELTICDVLKKSMDVSVPDATLALTPNLFIVPSFITLAFLEAELMSKPRTLRRSLEPYKDLFDYILIDTPPSLGSLMLNSIYACDEVLVPWKQEDPYATYAVPEFLMTICEAQEEFPGVAKLNGVVSTMKTPSNTDGGARLRVARANQEMIDLIFTEEAFLKTSIPKDTKIPEFAFMGKTSSISAQSAPSSLAYRMLADEIIRQEENYA